MSQYPAPYAPPAPRASNPADSIGSWIVAIIVASIPVVGFIYLLVVAFGGSASQARRNWARAQFILSLIAIALMVLFIAAGGLAALGQGSVSS